jgi:hypothetical protein
MCKGLSTVLIIFSFSVNAQQKENEKKIIVSEGLNISSFRPYTMDERKPRIIYHAQQEKPILILNGKETTYELIKSLKSDSLESISVEKGNTFDGVQREDRLVITTKSKTSNAAISLPDLLKKYKIPKTDRMIFSIDGEIVNENTESMYFDESNLMQITVISLDKVDLNGDLIYLKILTRTPENVKKANTIYIR